MNKPQKQGMYIHVPFCEGKCPYCDFYSVKADNALMDAYTDSLIRALSCSPVDGIFDTIYFGGGTPNLLGASRIEHILSACYRTFSIADDTEITLEANPNTLTAPLLADLRGLGVTRLSIGAQSIHPHELALLGRRHDSSQIFKALDWAQAVGFKHVSLDLMMGLPGQQHSDIQKSVDTVAVLPIDHLSVYLLKIEEGTPFSTRYAELDDDTFADFYLSTVDTLDKHGFIQYEISNFTRPGGESRHNLKYWRLDPYLGIGPSAHSFMNGRRFFFESDLQTFLSASNPFDCCQDDGPGGDGEEYIMLGLRLAAGVSLSEAAVLGIDASLLAQRAHPLLGQGYARLDGDRLALTPKGFLISNRIIAHLLA